MSDVFVLLRYENIHLYNVYEIPIVKFGICECIPSWCIFIRVYVKLLCMLPVYIQSRNQSLLMQQLCMYVMYTVFCGADMFSRVLL